MKLEKGYHFLIIFLWPSTVCKYGTGKTGRTSSLGLNCGTGNGWNRLWNRGAPNHHHLFAAGGTNSLLQEVTRKREKKVGEGGRGGQGEGPGQRGERGEGEHDSYKCKWESRYLVTRGQEGI